MPPLLSYDLKRPAPRSAAEEWQPHERKSEKSIEWWYVTALVNDTAGHSYFLMWCVFHFKGGAIFPWEVTIPPGERVVLGLAGLTDYANDWRMHSAPGGLMKDEDTWEPARSTLRFVGRDAEAGDFTSAWSFDGDALELDVSSSALSWTIRMTGGSQVMWARDRLGVEGVIQEGGEEDRSFYYSLPRLLLTGRATFADADGARRETDITGQGWVDRQWGEFVTKSWEWSSLRFNSGARVNLYSFANGHRAAAWQRPDGSTEWFDEFAVRQNGYLRTPERGVWVSWGWTYELPLEIEGSHRFTLIPFSEKDVFELDIDTFFEGPSRLIDDTTGRQVGVAVTESMDVRAMGNFPYGPNQR